MRSWLVVLAALGGAAAAVCAPPIVAEPAPRIGRIEAIEPPEHGFFTKKLDFEGIPVKAAKVVDDRALYEGRSRLAMVLARLPNVIKNLRAAGAELHIIGKDQVTSDLPDYRYLRDQKIYGDQTVDERTRGLGGLNTSCGEENLLRLPKDRYRGMDICVHEFAHNIYMNAVDEWIRQRFVAQMKRSTAKGLWVGSYAGSNELEYFAELSVWYWGTHGDMRMTGEKPKNGREGLKAYDPEAYELVNAFYSGCFPVSRLTPKPKISTATD